MSAPPAGPTPEQVVLRKLVAMLDVTGGGVDLARPEYKDALRAFLKEKLVCVLRAAYDGKFVHMTTEASGYPPGWPRGAAEVFLTKTAPVAVTADNFLADVTVSTVPRGASIETLQSTLHHVYVPSLLKDPTRAGQLGGDARTMLVDLDKTLAKVVRHAEGEEAGGAAGATGEGGEAGAGGQRPSAISRGTLSCCDEVAFWEESARALRREAPAAFARILGPLATRFDTMRDLPLPNTLDLIEDARGTLDALWRARVPSADAYPQARMNGLLTLMAGQLSEHIIRCVGAGGGGIGTVSAAPPPAGSAAPGGSSAGGEGAGAAPASVAPAYSVWDAPWSIVQNNMKDAARIVESWLSMVESLTKVEWPNYADHAWAGAAWQDDTLKYLWRRLDVVKRTRATIEQFAELLASGNASAGGGGNDGTGGRNQRLEATTRPLRRAPNPLSVSIVPDAEWESYLAAHEKGLEALEPAAADALRVTLTRLRTSLGALSGEVTRYGHVITRRGVLRLLVQEREAIVAAMSAEIAGLEKEVEAFEAAAGGKAGTSKAGAAGAGGGAAAAPSSSAASSAYAGLSKIDAIVWAQAIRSRASSLAASCATILRDVPAYKEMQLKVASLETRTSRLQQDCYRMWQEKTERSLREGKLSVQASGRVLQFDADGNMITGFTDEMKEIERDVQRLLQLSMPVPERIRAVAQEAARYKRFGVELEQIAARYNGLGSEILPSQRAMLLEPLVAFERLVTEQQGSGGKGGSAATITWGDEKQCGAYIASLNKASERVQLLSRRLAAAHNTLIEEVATLMAMDPIRQREAWKSRVAAARAVFADVARNYKPDQTSPWKRHWDYQLYKALDTCYRQGLESLHEALPEIKADLVLVPAPPVAAGALLGGTGGGLGATAGAGNGMAGIGRAYANAVQFKPALEDLRLTYYSQARKFVSMPLSFGGITDEADAGTAAIFSPMPYRNVASLTRVYRIAEILFARLAKFADRMRPWTAFACLSDVEAFVEGHVDSGAAFEANILSIRAKARELDKLPDLERFDCITVSLAPFKAAVATSLQRVQEALVFALRRSVEANLGSLEAFLDRAALHMGVKPTSMADIARLQKEWKALADQKSEMKTLLRACEDQQKLLANVAITGSDLDGLTLRLSRLPSKFEAFEVGMDAFNASVEDQRAALKANVANEINGVRGQIERFAMRWETLKPGKDATAWSRADAEAVFTTLSRAQEEFEELKKAVEAVNESCDSFGLLRPTLPQLEAVERDVTATLEVWSMYKEFDTERAALGNVDWLSFRGRLFDLQDLAAKWGDAVKGKPKDAVTTRIAAECEKIKKAMNGLKFARGEPFKEEHWTSMFKKLGMAKSVRLDTLCVHHFLDVLDAVAANVTWLKDMHARAQGEVQIREDLQELRAWCETAEFKLLDYVSAATGKTTALIREWKDLFTQIGDNQSLLSSLKDSPYFKPFADQAAVIETNLATLDACAQLLNSIQRRWVYLEPVFSRGALPSEAQRFKRVDDDYKDIMGKIALDPKAMSIVDAQTFPGLKDQLTTMLDQLERCQRALADFLEERRSRFPRFYFIGDDDLLEILGQAQNPAVIQTHLKKLYQGVHRVEFSGVPDPAATTAGGTGAATKAGAIVSLVSSAGEVVKLANPVPVTDDVTQWLNRLTDEMVATLTALLVQCLRSAESWETKLLAYPSQVHCLSEQIAFTQAVEAAIGSGQGGAALAPIKAKLQAALDAYTSKDFATQPVASLAIKALILDTVHHLDVIDQLIAKDVKDLASWQWQKQLRFYMEKNGRCVARMVDATVDYTYEYQGNAPKLVHTPLTDKCYMVLTQGLSQGLGGNPYGPAGTGKTESVKALGAAIGRQVLVFNCDEGLDFLSLGRIFAGLVKCGAWGCFDEFNRLKEDQLSAISQQIQIIQAAIKDRSPSIRLLGRDVEVDAHAGIFVTLNPAGKGYGGRSKLPDNLKQLFRPVAMTKPDNDLIAEVMLYSEGFMTAKQLGPKVVSLFSLSAQLLSGNRGVLDWGLRPLKTILNTGGSLIQQVRKQGVKPTPDMEKELLIKAIRVNTLSKLTSEDLVRFLGILSDLFPGTPSRDITSPELEAAIREVMTNKPFNLEFDAGQLKKMLQLKEALDQRIGCIVTGPSGCGKSTLWRVLQAALIKCGQSIVTHVMNPKSMPRSRLLGEMDHDTREWTDGVLTAAARAVVKEPQSVRSWIVCDGDVDPEWIESLNSVLDDNHLLTLPNGERISFGSNVNFLFETHDLSFASPATISRMGLIFLSDDDVDVRRIVNRWVAAQPEEARASLTTLTDQLFYRALAWAQRPPRPQVVETTLVGTVFNALSHLTGVKSKSEFVVGLIRGFGSNFDLDTRAALAREVLSWAGERPPDASAVLDLFVDPSTPAALRVFTPPAPGSTELTRRDVLAGAVVPTVGMQRIMATLQPWIDKMTPFILVGPEGAGKSLLIKHLVAQRRSTTMTTLHCSAQTSAEHVIQKIRQLCVLQSAATGRVFRPREGDRLVLFLKDINLPKPDQYGTCLLVAFLQQLLTFQGFYDENREFLGIERIHIVASMNPSTTVGRHPLSTRFTATVRIAYMDYPDPREMGLIYSMYVGAAFGPASGVRLADERLRTPAGLAKVAQTMVDVHTAVAAKFSPDEHRHYMFTPRDVTAWVFGLMRYPVASEPFLEALAHEGARIYRDRLVDAEAGARFDSILAQALRTHWGGPVDLRDVCYTALAVGRTTRGAGAGGEEGGAAGGAGSTGSTGAPLSRHSLADVKTLVERGLTVYEREERDLNLFLFPEVIDHVTQVDRVLTQAGGCTLLVGRSGVGRRSAATLAAHMHGMAWFSPPVGRGYGLKTFFADLKTVLAVAGVNDEETVLYLEDHHFTDGDVLESVNSLLAAGEVPGLYTHEELEPLLSPLKEQMMSETGAQAFRTPYDFFVHRIRANLHVCVGMDPTHPDFRLRCERNPALYNRCAIVWMGSWRKQAMTEVVPLALQDVLAQVAAKGVPPEAIVEVLTAMHTSFTGGAAAASTTPRDLMALLRAYRGVYASKVGGSAKEVERLQAGLGKLEDAQKAVDDLSRDASVQREQLRTKQAAADAAMNEITKALSEAADRRRGVEVLQESLAKAEQDTLARKKAVEIELSGVLPIVEAAKAAVGSIKKENLDEIKALKMPPEAISDVLSAVLMLLGVGDTSWTGMKKFLGGRGVISDILGYDARRMTHDIRRAVQKVLKEKADSFEEANIRRASVAAAPLATWVRANIEYNLTLEKIAPLEAELSVASAALQKSQEGLDANRRELDEIDVRVGRLKDDFAARTAEAESLKLALGKTEDTLRRAQALLGELSGERSRWRDRIEALSRDQASMPLQAVLGAGFLTYLGRCSEDVRAECLSAWATLIKDVAARARPRPGGSAVLSLPELAELAVSKFNPVRLLSSESETLVWKLGGLPSDALSVENVVMIMSSSHTGRVPFIVDPATAATDWLQRHLEADKSTPFEVLSASDPRFQNQVELAVRFGKTLLIREIDRVEPSLYPLLRRDFYHQGPRLTVSIGEKTVDFNERFKLFLATRSPNPSLPPDAAALVTETNFTVTRSGLESQLLAATIQHEQPELESKKSTLLRQEEALKVELVAVEDALLEALATSSGNILDNTALLSSLSQAKAKSSEISEALSGSQEASEELDRQRNVYRPFARAGSTLFFALRPLAGLNNMYQFSLASFLELFKATLQAGAAAAAGNAAAVETRIYGLIASLEVLTLMSIGRALLKEDRLMFALHIVRTMHPEMLADPRAAYSGAPPASGEDAAASSPLWRYFLGETVSEGGTEGPRDAPPWVARERLPALRSFATQFPELYRELQLPNTERWGAWASSGTPERAFPPDVVRVTTPFQRLLVIQTLRPDRLLSALQAFVTEALRVPSVNPPSVSIARLYEESRPAAPILMVTMAGADPCKELADFAATVVGRDRYCELAMGGGMQEEALRALRKAASEGQWLCLKNLHLVISWLSTLEKEISTLTPHPEFRLWLTTECHPAFPAVLLQQSTKVTFEAPPGLKKNLERTLEAWGPEFISRGSPLRGQLLFLMAWLHAVVQERRTYVPQGWTKAYEFSFADLRAGANVIDTQLARAGGDRVPWAYLHGLIENTVYGGRIDTNSDRRVLLAYLATIFHPDVLSGKGGRTVARGVPLPANNSPAEFARVVAALPESDPPYLFALPENIERSVQRVVSGQVITALKSLTARATSEGGFSRDRWRARLGPLLEAWERLTLMDPAVLDVSQPPPPPAAREGKEVDPVTGFIAVENALAVRLVARVHADLTSIKTVLFGSGLLSSSVIALGSCLVSDAVPPAWASEWEGPETPLKWLTGLVSRRVALLRWDKANAAGSLLQGPIRLGELYRPSTFLNAIRQQTARRLRAAAEAAAPPGGAASAVPPMDSLKLVTAWDARALAPGTVAALPITLTGLLIQGATFDIGRGSLAEAVADAPELSTAPDVTVAWMPPDFPEPIPAQAALSVPLYQGLDRATLMTDLVVPCAGDKARWVLTGVALFLEGE